LATFARVLGKALVIVLLANLVVLWSGVNPTRALITLNTWDMLGRGRARLAYPSDFQNGQLPLEALLAAHAISAGPKPADEYRVVLLGESGIAGWGVSDEGTLAGQLTARGVRVDDRRLVAYNLAYPQPGVARDVLILDAALDYDPDLVIWFVTPASVDDSGEVIGANRVFFGLNRARLDRLVQDYPELLRSWQDAHAPDLYAPEPVWQRWVGPRDQDLLPVWMNAQFYPFVPPDLAESDRRMGSEPVPEEARFTINSPGFHQMPNDTWTFLRAGCRIAQTEGVDLLLINEPMLIGSSGASDVNYNAQYQRALYDRYRDSLGVYAPSHGLWYADLWNTIPSARYTDTPLHADAEGYAILSAALEPLVTQDRRGSRCD
jgi:hypothetical protein